MSPPVLTCPPLAMVSELPWLVFVPVMTAAPMVKVFPFMFHNDPVPVTVAEPLTMLMLLF